MPGLTFGSVESVKRKFKRAATPVALGLPLTAAPVYLLTFILRLGAKYMGDIKEKQKDSSNIDSDLSYFQQYQDDQKTVVKGFLSVLHNFINYKNLTIDDYHSTQTEIQQIVEASHRISAYHQNELTQTGHSFPYQHPKSEKVSAGIGPEYHGVQIFIDSFPALLNSLLMEFSDSVYGEQLRYFLFLRDANSKKDRALRELSSAELARAGLMEEDGSVSPVNIQKAQMLQSNLQAANPEAYAAIMQEYEQDVAAAKALKQKNMERHQAKDYVWMQNWSNTPDQYVTGLGQLTVPQDLLKPAQKLENETIDESQQVPPIVLYTKDLNQTLFDLSLFMSKLGTGDIMQNAQQVYADATAINGALAQAEAQGITVGSNTVNNATSVHVAEVTINSAAQDLTGTGEDFGRGIDNILTADNAAQGVMA